MTSSSFKKPSARLIGAMFILLGASAAPSQATTLTGFSTYGDMMSGMRVSANFLDGTSQSLFWDATGNEAGGVFGNGWSLTQSGNSYESPWSFSNFGQGITSLVIEAIPGNSVFDINPNLYGSLQTPGSAEGWEFQTLVGQAPNSYRYYDPIDISNGDLFGTLSAYWSSGFTGTMQFRTDTDSGSRTDPVQPRDPVAAYTAPTVYLSTPTIYESQSASAFLSATAPNTNALTFSLNGSNLGTTPISSGTASVSTNLGSVADNGVYTYTAQARDERGYYSQPVSSTLTVLNVDPSVTNLNIATIYEGQQAWASLSATDPGTDPITFSLNGNIVGTDNSTSGTRSAIANLGYFTDDAYVPYTAQALDDDGGVSAPVSSGLTVLNVAPTVTNLNIPTIYEGQRAWARMSATDPGTDPITFSLNGNIVGTDNSTSGPRSVNTNLGRFTDDAYIPYTGGALDDDGGVSAPVSGGLTVLNVAPSVTRLRIPTIYEGQSASAYMSATDPGTDPIRFSLNGNIVGTDNRRSGTRFVNTNLGYFADNGYIPYRGRALDDDGGVSAPVSRGLTVLNVAPTLTRFHLSSNVIYQGEAVSAWLSATDPGADRQAFFVNGTRVGSNPKTTGTRWMGTDLGTFTDVGTYTFRGISRDKDRAFSNRMTRSLTVLNVAPTITNLTGDLSVNAGEVFDFLGTATDPGINDLLTYAWDLNNDGVYDDFIGTNGEWIFENFGTHVVGLEVSDGNGGYTYGSFTVEAVATPRLPVEPTPVESVPEPGSVLGVLAFGAFGGDAVLKRKQQQKAKGNKP